MVVSSVSDGKFSPGSPGGTTFGLFSALAAFILWGLAAMYWPLVEPASPLEVLAHRVVWTFVVCLALLPLVHGWADVGRAIRTPRLLGLMGLATLFISINWGTFIWAVSNNQVLQTSLGYFINPILSVLLGVVLLGERLRNLQWVAVGIGGVAMLVLVAGFDGFPVVAVTLAVSFSFYGLVKKRANIDAIPSLAIESGLGLPVALAFLAWLWSTGDLSFGDSATHTILLVGAGVITATPLLLFGFAAIRIPLSTLGILQYVAPLLMFILALTVFDEPMSGAQWAGFLLVWLALGVFSWDLIAHTARRSSLDTAQGN
jgi:chloramphenicol-sensitive protein RarD